MTKTERDIEFEAPARPGGTPDRPEGVGYGRALVPVANVAENRHRVITGFWPKLRRTAGRIPFAEDAAAAYYAAIDPKTPGRVKALLLAALAYFIIPTDLIPDFIAGFGFTDDASVLTMAVAAMSGQIRRRHRNKARAALLCHDTEAGTDLRNSGNGATTANNG